MEFITVISILLLLMCDEHTAQIASVQCTGNGGECSSIANSECDIQNSLCVCKTDFAVSGSSCEAIITTVPCSAAGSECDVDANSRCDKGNEICTCKSGFTVLGARCVLSQITAVKCSAGGSECDVDENSRCDKDNELCICQNGFTVSGGRCVPKTVTSVSCTKDGNECGSFKNSICGNEDTCVCLSGYDVSGTDCEDVDECEEDFDDCDKTNGKCTNTIGSYSCECNPNYSSDGKTCTRIVTTVTCTEIGGECNIDENSECDTESALCVCKTGYRVKEARCAASCTDEPCLNGATCTVNNNKLICSCLAGYEGIYCQTAKCLDTTCQNGGTCSDTDNKTVCECMTGFQGKYCQTKVAKLPLGYGSNVGQTKISSDKKDWCKMINNFDCPVKVHDEYRNKFFVCENGFVTFSKKYKKNSIPSSVSEREKFKKRDVVAPYFSNIDSRTTGGVWYRVYDKTEYDSDTTVKTEISSILDDAGYGSMDVFFLLVVTWADVKEYNQADDKTSTFQLILVSDGKHTTFAFFAYLEDKMNFATNENLIGIAFVYQQTLSFRVNNPVARFTNLGRSGFVMFSLNSGRNAKLSDCFICKQWTAKEAKTFDDLNKEWNSMPMCPCDINTIQIVGCFEKVKAASPTSIDTYSIKSNEEYNFQGMTCTYQSNSYISSGENVGFKTKYNSLTFGDFAFFTAELDIRTRCCNAGLCDDFYSVRPMNTKCSASAGFLVGGGTGDPHITTLDGKSYTFNGEAEYTMLSVKKEGIDFVLQARTSPFLRDDGSSVGATVFTAFAARDKISGSRCTIELNKNIGVGMQIKVNGKSFSSDFASDELFSTSEGSVSLERQNRRIKIKFTKSKISFKIAAKLKKFMTIDVAVPKAYKGLTKGLLGNSNSDPSDDFNYPNGTVLSASITEREVFNFAQSWMITSSDESVFEYPLGGSFLDFQNLNPSVNFLDEANQTFLAEATTFCGVGNNPCIFDKVFTGSDVVAEDTKVAFKEQEKNRLRLENIAPTLILDVAKLDRSTGKLHITIGTPTEITLLGNDDGNIKFEIKSGAEVAKLLEGNTDKSKNLQITFQDETPKTVSLIVVDDHGVHSALLVLDIILCTGCNGNGYCIYTNTRTTASAVEGFSIAQCECNDFYEGEDCADNFDACEEDPCSLDRECMDVDPVTHENTGNAFTCGACPNGYTADGQDCMDINECDAGTKPCSDICENTFGSYVCKCKKGRRAKDATTCIDINECEEATSNCEQVCTNEDQGFTCSCYNGYNYDVKSNTCTLSDAALCKNSGCSSDHGGCFVENTVTKCFCNKGYKFGDDGKTCDDIDECDQNICSGTCQNSDGSYTCGCLTGFTLNADKTTCSECTAGFWGNNCAQTCSCSSLGSLECNNIKGCICKAGWEGTECTVNVIECLDANICNDDYKTCVDTLGSYNCDCIEHFQLNTDTGKCEDINECNDANLNKCQQKCINTEGGFVCECFNGYKRDPTDSTKCIDVNEFEVRNTGCHQTCENTKGSFNCLCYFGYSLNSDQKSCTQLTADTVCSNQGLTCAGYCQVGTDTAQCACPAGSVLAADDKQSCLDVNECEDSSLNKCDYPDTCKNINYGYTCSCPTGKFLEYDGITCTVCNAFHYGDNCQQECKCGVGAARCDPITGCVCKNGWTGEKCDIDRNECDVAIRPCKDVNSVCTNTPGGFTCPCKAGYFNNTNGQCDDIDECKNPQLNSCAQICENIAGSYTCDCGDGYTLDGSSCNDIDECSGINDCSQLCNNFDGSYKCSCNPGYILSEDDRKTCTVQSECSEGNSCGANTDCLLVGGEESCVCKKGFEKENEADTACTDIDECYTNRCVNGNCEDNNGGFTCTCEKGFKLDKDQITCKPCKRWLFGEKCEQKCGCKESNTDTCNAVTGECTCKSGWTGDDCSTDIDECTDISTKHNCKKNSFCVNTDESFVCECTEGFFKISENNCIECDSKHYGKDCIEGCKCNFANTKSCNSVTGECTCFTGWTGDTCSEDVDECKPNPCMDTHKSQCKNNQGSYTCQCDSGFELDFNDICVDTNECQRGTSDCIQKCTNTEGGFTCSCDIGYSGTGNDCTKCAVDKWGEQCANDCSCDNAKSSGCDHVTGCICSPGWQGATCTEDVDECTTNTDTCPVNSLCTNTIGSRTCACKRGYDETLSGCIECTSNTYGMACSMKCDCEDKNTVNIKQECDHMNGTCFCLLNWTGARCDIDVDECTLQTDDCTGDNEGCHNIDGGFECSCFRGFKRNDAGICVLDDTPVPTTTETSADKRKINVVMVLDIQLPAGIDFNVESTYNEYKEEVTNGLIAIYKRRFSTGTVFSIFISSLKKGILEVEYDVIVPTTTLTDVAIANAKLATSKESLQIFKQNVTASRLVINNVTVPTGVESSDAVTCRMFEAVSGQCTYRCIVTDNQPSCMKEDETDNLPMVIGLGVGISVLFISVALFFYYHYRRHRQSSEYSRKYDDNESVVVAGKMPRRINTSMHPGPRGGPLYRGDYLDLHSVALNGHSERLGDLGLHSVPLSGHLHRGNYPSFFVYSVGQGQQMNYVHENVMSDNGNAPYGHMGLLARYFNAEQPERRQNRENDSKESVTFAGKNSRRVNIDLHSRPVGDHFQRGDFSVLHSGPLIDNFQRGNFSAMHSGPQSRPVRHRYYPSLYSGPLNGPLQHGDYRGSYENSAGQGQQVYYVYDNTNSENDNALYENSMAHFVHELNQGQPERRQKRENDGKRMDVFVDKMPRRVVTGMHCRPLRGRLHCWGYPSFFDESVAQGQYVNYVYARSDNGNGVFIKQNF